MFCVLSLPMEGEHSRKKEQLDVILSRLYELELLRHRLESRVMSALCLEDQQSSKSVQNQDHQKNHGVILTTTSWCVGVSSEQRVVELHMISQGTSGDDIDVGDESGRPLIPSGFVPTKKHPVSSHSPSVLMESGEPEPEGKCLPDQMKPGGQTGEVNMKQEDLQLSQKAETYIHGLIQRRAFSTRPVKPRTSLPSVLRQSSLCCKDQQHLVPVSESSAPQSERSPLQVSPNLKLERYGMEGPLESALDLSHYRLGQTAPHHLGLCDKTQLPSLLHATSAGYPSCKVLQSHQDSDLCDPDSTLYFHNYSSPPVLLVTHQLASQDEQLVNAEYIPARACRTSTRSYTHRHSNPFKGHGHGMPKPIWSSYSPERRPHQEQPPTASQNQPFRLRGGPKKCRSNEDKSGTNRKVGRKACRSQSEYSPPRAPDRKYNMVERDRAGPGSRGLGSCSGQSKSKRPQHGCGSYRRWQSSLELSQDEADPPPTPDASQTFVVSNQRDHCPRHTRKSRTATGSYVQLHDSHLPHRPSNRPQHVEYQKERKQVDQVDEDYRQPSQADSESSLSEADSPDSSTVSSESDESGGLVWPQQLSIQPCNPFPPVLPGAPSHPKAFIKIKASNALKKKILRFRSGSLKLMTTV